MLPFLSKGKNKTKYTRTRELKQINKRTNEQRNTQKHKQSDNLGICY